MGIHITPFFVSVSHFFNPPQGISSAKLHLATEQAGSSNIWVYFLYDLVTSLCEEKELFPLTIFFWVTQY